MKAGSPEALCWFCEVRPAVPEHTYKVEMRKRLGAKQNVGQGTKTVYYQTANVSIPRCATCAEIHNAAKTTRLWTGCLPVALAGLLLCSFTYFISNPDSIPGFLSNLTSSQGLTSSGTWVIGVMAGLLLLGVLGFLVAAPLLIRSRFKEAYQASKIKLDSDKILGQYPEVADFLRRGYQIPAWKSGDANKETAK